MTTTECSIRYATLAPPLTARLVPLLAEAFADSESNRFILGARLAAAARARRVALVRRIYAVGLLLWTAHAPRLLLLVAPRAPGGSPSLVEGEEDGDGDSSEGEGGEIQAMLMLRAFQDRDGRPCCTNHGGDGPLALARAGAARCRRGSAAGQLLLGGVRRQTTLCTEERNKRF